MIRFFRVLLFLLGMVIFGLVVVRTIQPAEATGIYHVVSADIHQQTCCANYLISEENHTAVRTNIYGELRIVGVSSYSPSGAWRFVNLTISFTDTVALMIPSDGSDIIQLPSPIEEGWYMHWSSYKDVFYYLYSDPPYTNSALYRVTPTETTPIRLTQDQFRWVNQIYDQTLPPSHFSPYGLLFYSIGFLVFAGLLGYKIRA